MGGERPPSLLTQPSYLTSQVSKYGRRHIDSVLYAHSLGTVQYAVLSALHDFGTLSQQQLADGLDLHKSHLIAPLDELERRGLVTRVRDEADRRRNRVALTPAGTALVNELQPAAQRSQQGLVDALSAREQRTLVSLLQKVLAANDAARLSEDW